MIVIKRTDLTFDENLPQSFKHDVKGEFINVVKSSSGWSKNNRYSRFNVLTGQKTNTRICQDRYARFCKLYIHHSDDDIIYGTDE